LNTALAATGHIFSDEPTILEGSIVPPNLGPNDQSTSEVSEEDIPWNHFTHDFTVRVTPDAPYKHLLSSWERFKGATFPLDFVKYGTEIHPPRAMVTFRINHPALDSFPRERVSAPNFPGPQGFYLPVTGFPPALPSGGPTDVPLTEADVYVTGNGGNANDLC